jgi:hypothetical protein
LQSAYTAYNYLLASSLTCDLDSITTLDDIGLEADGTWTAVEFQKKPTSIAQYGTALIASPQGGGAGAAVLTYWLRSISK